MGYQPGPIGGSAPTFAQPYSVPVAPLEKPTAAMVLSLIGGIFILLWGALIAWVGLTFQAISFGYAGGGVALIGVVEALLGLFVIVFGVLMYVSPEHHLPYGVLVLVCSIVSLIGLGGLFLGFILGLIGGILGIVHKATPSTPTVVYVQPSRICPKCGRAVSPDVKFCASCGNPLG